MNRFLLITVLLFSITLLKAQELLPTSTTGQIIKHTYYTLSYSETHEQAEWVYYELTSDLIQGSQARTDNFREDPFVTSGSAQLTDYRGSGFDRGHLCPAGDMKLNRVAMSETFYMSNMSPQIPSFNRGIWKKLEAVVRNWGAAEGRIYVVTGGVLSSFESSIGANNVTVPKHYFKVIYNPNKDGKMIAFILPNEKSSKPLESFVVSVDEIESRTGIDFFPDLNDSLENALESNSNITSWTFKQYSAISSLNYKNKAVQCNGIAKSTGVRCKKKTTNTNGYCHLHQSQTTGSVKKVSATKETSSGRCIAITKAGNRCKRKASTGSSYCWQHK